jgi:hypothetical protein
MYVCRQQKNATSGVVRIFFSLAVYFFNSKMQLFQLFFFSFRPLFWRGVHEEMRSGGTQKVVCRVYAQRLIGALVSTVVLSLPRAGAVVPAAFAFSAPHAVHRPGLVPSPNHCFCDSSSMVLRCASRPLSRAILGVRAMSAMSAGQTPDSDRKNKTTKPPAAEDSKGVNTEELSGRAKFKAVPIDAAVMKRIYDMRLTSPMGAAMRNAIRSDPEGVAAEKLYKGFSRGPLYRDIPGRDSYKSPLCFIFTSSI